jgi:hypothetical protein
MTSSGRPESAGRPILTARLRRPVPSPVRWVDRSIFGKAVAAAVGASKSEIHFESQLGELAREIIEVEPPGWRLDKESGR